MANDEKANNVVDCSGLCCSLPLVNARIELDKLESGQTLEVITTCPSAEADIKILTRLKAYRLVRTWREADQTHFLIKKL
jgi:tRNA 2-thiouridine synthesizing protein A